MLDFRRHSRPPQYFGSKEQRRLLLLVALAVLLAFSVMRLRDSEWGFGFGAGGADRGPRRPALAARQNSPAGNGETGPRENRKPAPIYRNALFPGVRADYLKSVEDDTVFRAAEADAWFHLLALLQKTGQGDLEAATTGRVGFRQLDQQSQAYRGRLVSVEGVVRSARETAAPANGYGIQRYYQLWLQPERGSPPLVVVYCLELPEGFPLGAQLDAPCATTGFYFKRWAYQSQGGIATAPLILARTVDWQPPPPAPPKAPLGEQIVWAVVVASILAALAVAVFVARARAAARTRHLPADGPRLEELLASQTNPPPADSRDPNGRDPISRP